MDLTFQPASEILQFGHSNKRSLSGYFLWCYLVLDIYSIRCTVLTSEFLGKTTKCHHQSNQSNRAVLNFLWFCSFYVIFQNKQTNKI